MKRRDFLLTAAGTAMTAAVAGDTLAQTAHRRDVSYEPDRPLESTGLGIGDVVKILKKGRKGNVPPVLREEILDNPDAVFIIYGNTKAERNEKGGWKPMPDQFERFGRRVSGLVFRKGSDKKGCTFIKPNLVGGLRKDRPVTETHTGIVHPFFVAGFVDGLRDIGNSNLAIGARGALRHNHVVDSGFGDLLYEHNFPLLEAHVQYFRNYRRRDLVWHENPNGLVQRKFCTYKPVYEKGTSFINMAHAHDHKVGHTTLTIKNIQGVMPRGYGHICDAWTSMDMWRASLMKHFNADYRQAIEKSYLRHAQMGYQHWDAGGFYKTYRKAGGWSAFEKALGKYRDAKSKEDRDTALNSCMDIADTRLFWTEIWAQRMLDIVEALPQPMVNMVEGTIARGAGGGVHGDFVTVGRSTVAVDAVTSYLMGQEPREMPYLRMAKERGLGENDMDRIPVYILSEKGVERVRDYHRLTRHSCGIGNFNGIGSHPPVFFG